MSEIVPVQLLESLERYHNDRMLESCLKSVRLKFLEKSGLPSLSGRPYMVLCLLVAQAMSDMMAGYSGSCTAPDNILYEAIGMALASNGENPQRNLMHARYLALYKQVFVLQTTHKEFADMLDSVLALDMKETRNEHE